jgi:hypothetical protein
MLRILFSFVKNTGLNLNENSRKGYMGPAILQIPEGKQPKH